MTKRKRRHRRSVDVRINWLQPHVDGFKDWLAQRNYSPATITEVVRLLACGRDWVRASPASTSTRSPAASPHRRRVFRGSKTARAPQGAAALFIAYLREKSVLPPERHPSLEETWPALAAFRRWMREQRGVKDSRSIPIRRSWSIFWRRSATDPAAYTAAAIRGFVLERAKPHGRGRAQSITVATRAYPQISRGDRAVSGRPGTCGSELREAGSWRRRHASSGKPTSTASLPL